ncbi:hypothetical protein CAEBREN_15869 [Caenorhabditis brenneri]|uniref:G-protein coupled receptors family 1 profile domain-containing protein n=1 Tax=Caenorhabditis brenneri TaxID=135651 RepID=G0NXA9_CAEBE|nr:hypothetical protein CAEBREN_15869 [Caenorhabditis brenneri]
MEEMKKLPQDETVYMDELCPWYLSSHLAVGVIPLFTVGLILTGISVYVYTRPYQLKTTVYSIKKREILHSFLISDWLPACFPLLFRAIISSNFLRIIIACTNSNTVKFDRFETNITHFCSSCSKVEKGSTIFKDISMSYIFPMTHVTKNMCVCISIMISVQQWIAVFLPMEVRNLCSMKRTRNILLFSFLFSVFLAIPRFLDEKKSILRELFRYDSWKDNFLIEKINIFDEYVFNAFIIFTVLLFINISIIGLLKYSEHERMRMTSQSYRDRRTSLMLLAVLFAYVATHFPSMLIQYGIIGYLKESLPTEIERNKSEISNFFMCCHPLFSFTVI